MKISLRCALVHICICHICLRSADETGTTAVDIVDGRRRDCMRKSYGSIKSVKDSDKKEENINLVCF